LAWYKKLNWRSADQESRGAFQSSLSTKSGSWSPDQVGDNKRNAITLNPTYFVFVPDVY